MNKEHFFEAIEIISKHHTSKVTINQPINNFVGDLGSKQWTIHIHACCHSVIKELLSEGFILHMGEYGMSVSKF
jgi:predicted SpoU family rRNA methylase